MFRLENIIYRYLLTICYGILPNEIIIENNVKNTKKHLLVLSAILK